MENEKDILVVEDIEENREAAEGFFRGNGVNVVFAPDYNMAMVKIEKSLRGVFTDIFFPREIGSEDRELGFSLVKAIGEDCVPEIGQVEGIVAEFRKYIDLDPNLLQRLTNWASLEVRANEIFNAGNTWNPSNIPSIQYYACLATQNVSRELLTQILRGNLDDLLYSSPDKDYERTREKIDAMMDGIRKSPANQPLGVLICEKAEEKNLPFIMVTSTYHHDILTDLVCVLQRNRKWPEIVDNREGNLLKSTRAFWERAYAAFLAEEKNYERRNE